MSLLTGACPLAAQDSTIPFEPLEAAQYTEAFSILEPNALAGDGQSALILAVMYTTGAGVAIDYDEAERWMEISAQANNPLARAELGWARSYASTAAGPQSVDDLPPSLVRESDHGLVYQHRAAIAWNIKAAETGDPVALYNLAQYTRLAPNLVGGSRPDFPLRLFEAAQAGSIPAIHQLLTEAHHPDSEWSFTPETVRACAEAGSTLGDALSQFQLAQLLHEEAGPTDDRSAARQLLLLSAQQGYAPATELMKVWNREHLSDDEQTQRHLTDARKTRLAQFHALAKQADVGDIESRYAQADLVKLSRSDDDALLVYGEFLLRNPDRRLTEPDDYIARLLALKAAGNVAAGGLAGRLLSEGRYGLERDLVRGNILVQEAARAGDARTQVYLYARGDLHSDSAWRDASRQEDHIPSQPVEQDEARRKAHWLLHADPSPAELQSRIDRLELPASGTFQPQVVHQPPPHYPLLARLVDIEGQVMVSFIVTEQGDVHDPHVIQSTHSGLERDAVDAVRHWRFAPGRKNGRPVNMRLQVPIVFSITE